MITSAELQRRHHVANADLHRWVKWDLLQPRPREGGSGYPYRFDWLDDAVAQVLVAWRDASNSTKRTSVVRNIGRVARQQLAENVDAVVAVPLSPAVVVTIHPDWRDPLVVEDSWGEASAPVEP